MSILSFKNAVIDSNILVRDLPYWDWTAGHEITGRNDRGIMSDADIDRILGASSYYYMSNQLVLSLRPADDEVEMHRFKTNIGEYAGQFGFTTFWRLGDPEPVREWDNWEPTHLGNAPGRTTNSVRYVSVSNTRIVIEIDRSAVQNVRHRDPTFGFPDPLEYGILVLPIQFVDPSGTEYTKYFGLKVSTNEPLSPVLEERREIPPPANNEYTTPVYSFENLYIPTLTCSLIYNYYELNEENYEIISNRDYSGTNLRDIPKYVELSWTQAPIYTPPLVLAPSGTLRNSGTPGGSGTSGLLAPPVTREDGSAIAGATVGSTVAIGGFVFTIDADSSAIGGTRTSEDFDRAYGEGGSTLAGRAGSLGILFGTSTEGSTNPDLVGVDLGSDVAGIIDMPADDPRASVDRAATTIPTPDSVIPIIKTGYTGYVIQKDRWDEVEQAFIPVDAILINGRTNTKWIDWKIAYNESYRYKVRSIFRFVNRDNLTMYEDSDELSDYSVPFAIFDEGSISSFDSYFYDSKFSLDCDLYVEDLVPPPPPDNVRIYPDSKEKNIFITWNQKNKNKDVLGFNVYKKKEGETFFRKLNSDLIDIRNNFFLDYSIDFGEYGIYAIEAIDVHYNYSNLSAQYRARIIEQNIDLPKRCEELPQFIRDKGERIGELVPVLSTGRSDNLMFFNDKFKIRINPLYKHLERNDPFLLKIRSLDTFMEKEIKIDFKINTIYHKTPLNTEERVRNIGGAGALRNERYDGAYEGRIIGPGPTRTF